MYFNSRPRVGGDFVQLEQTEEYKISIHAPAWGATRPGWQAAHAAYFNSRPRVGGDLRNSLASVTAERISIHAPAWGATNAWGFG